MNYWTKQNELKKKAKEHTAKMNANYGTQIKDSISRSVIYGGPNNKPTIAGESASSKQFVWQETTDKALFKIPADNHGKIALLNFASYNNPGGKFLEGSSAQEESCCHASFLYNVLLGIPKYYEWNNQHKNRTLYEDRAIYSPDVIFEAGDFSVRKADVITCAAPNRSVLEKYGSFTEEENDTVLKERIDFVRDICTENKVNTVVLGAWGCGVFRQNPERVATLFKESFANTGMIVVYAVPDDKTYSIFKSVI